MKNRIKRKLEIYRMVRDVTQDENTRYRANRRLDRYLDLLYKHRESRR